MAVLQRTELESSPLADLHAIASELGLEGFRAKRKDDLIGAILSAQGGEEEPEPPAVADEPEPDEVPSDEALEGPSGEAAPDDERDVDTADQDEPDEDEDEPDEEDADGEDPDRDASGEDRPDLGGAGRDGW